MQANGIEDARFVAFSDEGRNTYYATFTAYSGRGIRSELLETKDFVSFRLAPLKGAAARNKGMALFPRQIGGRYALIVRHDHENLHPTTRSVDHRGGKEGVRQVKYRLSAVYQNKTKTIN